MAGTLDRFLTNMFMSGIITQKEGVNYMWHNSFIFFPSYSFAKFYDVLRKDIGEELDEFFYWLGYIQGKNSTKIIAKRFGYSNKDFQSFIDGATIIGMGDLKLLDINKDYTEANLEATNSIFALNLKKLSDKINFADYYLAGIIAGGTEILMNSKFICKETSCMIKDSQKCIYHLKKGESNLKLINKKVKRLNEYDEKISQYYLTKESFIKISLDKKFYLKDGAFYFNNVQGFNIETYLILLLDIYLRENHKKIYEKALNDLFNENLKILYPTIKQIVLDKPNLDKLFSNLEICGYGKFISKNRVDNKIYIESPNNIFVNEFKLIFNEKDTYSNMINEIFLKNLFENISNKKCKVKTINSVMFGNETNLFEITLN